MNRLVPRPHGDDGFTIVESMIALAMLFAVMVGMLATITGGLRGVITGRQRQHALALATAALESARATSFAKVGHDLAGDATLLADPAVTPAGASLQFEGEDLVGVAGAPSPFAPHDRTETEEQTTYTSHVYVTWAGTLKRVTVVVSWGQAQYGAAGTAPVVRLSSLLAPSGEASATTQGGAADADGPSVTVTGWVSGLDLESARWWAPQAHGAIGAGFIETVQGRAETARARLDSPDDPPGCSTAPDGTWASCGGLRAATAADNDSATATPETGTTGSLLGGSGSAGALRPLRFTLVSGPTAASSSTTRSGAVGDGDSLPYHQSTAQSAGSRLVLTLASDSVGRLFSSSGSPSATSTLDVDPAGDHRWIGATSQLVLPNLDLMTLDQPAGSFSNYRGAVRLTSATLGASAWAGTGAPAPALTGGPVAVQLYSTEGSNHYECYLVTPRTAAVTTCSQPGTPAVFQPQTAVVQAEDGVTYELTSAVRVVGGSVQTVASGATISAASARLGSWLVADVHADVFQSGSQVASFDLHLDAGSLAGEATFEAAP